VSRRVPSRVRSGWPYDSPNFLWFRARYRRFVYVERIAVAPSARGRGLARRLYDDLFAATHRRGHAHVVCEVNPASTPGFVEVGRASIHDNRKTVRYLQRTLVVTSFR
jgi:uncharacterized protein